MPLQVHGLIPFGGEIPRVLLNVRDDFLLCNGGRHVPERTEDEVFHLIGDHRRVVCFIIRFAVHHLHAKDLVAAVACPLVGAQHELRKVHHNGSVLVRIV